MASNTFFLLTKNAWDATEILRVNHLLCRKIQGEIHRIKISL